MFKMKMVVKIMWFMAVVLIVSGIPGGIIGYRYHRLSLLKSKVAEIVRRDNRDTEELLNYIAERDSETYTPAYWEGLLERRKNLIFELSEPYPNFNYPLREKLIEFLIAENMLVDAKRSNAQKASALLDAIRRLEASKRNYSIMYDAYMDTISHTASQYSSYEDLERAALPTLLSLKREASTRQAELNKEVSNLISECNKDVVVAKEIYKNLVSQETELENQMIKANIDFNTVLTKYKITHPNIVNP